MVNFDRCRKEIIKFESKRNGNNKGTEHPKNYVPEAVDVLRCHSKNLTFEPVCL